MLFPAILTGLLSLLEITHGEVVREKRQSWNEPPSQTRSLSNTYATNGDNSTTAEVLKLVTVGLLGGYAIRKVKMFNDRIYLSKYRRSYWLGSRYYYLDNFYFLETRDTCAFRMNETQRRDLEYTDGVPIVDVIYQCQRYAQYCCGLDCCDNVGKREANGAFRNTSNGNHASPMILFLALNAFCAFFAHHLKT